MLGDYMETNVELTEHVKKNSNLQHKNYSIFAMFLNQKSAKNAIKLLKSHGYLLRDISLLIPEGLASHDFVYQQDTSIKAGAMIGAFTGFFILGIVGFIIGLKDPMRLGWAAHIFYTMIGMFIGLLFGAASGALVGIGTPKTAAKRYNFYLKEGGIVVRLHLKDEADGQAANVLIEKAGGQDIVVLEESQIRSTIVPEKGNQTFH